MAKRNSGMIRFVVRYAGGASHYFTTSKYNLRSGDSIARILAAEKQASGELPAGEILSVVRAPYYEQPDYKAPRR
jgi:hypothetical protein